MATGHFFFPYFYFIGFAEILGHSGAKAPKVSGVLMAQLKAVP